MYPEVSGVQRLGVDPIQSYAVGFHIVSTATRCA